MINWNDKEEKQGDDTKLESNDEYQILLNLFNYKSRRHMYKENQITTCF